MQFDLLMLAVVGVFLFAVTILTVRLRIHLTEWLLRRQRAKTEEGTAKDERGQSDTR